MNERSGSERMKAFFLIASAVLASLAHAAPASAPARAKAIPVYGVQVVRTTPHDVNAFTEGLFFLNGWFYENTVLDGHSAVRHGKTQTGQVVQRANLPADVFGEGIAPWNGRLIGLTWKGQVGY